MIDLLTVVLFVLVVGVILLGCVGRERRWRRYWNEIQAANARLRAEVADRPEPRR